MMLVEASMKTLWNLLLQGTFAAIVLANVASVFTLICLFFRWQERRRSRHDIARMRILNENDEFKEPWKRWLPVVVFIVTSVLYIHLDLNYQGSDWYP